ncbi:hypothetical protein BGX23_005593, partial [Mortierella sp. AD031]
MLPTIKPRHYSVASSQKAHPNSFHLLIVAVEWTAPSGKARFGQCTRYLTSLGVALGHDLSSPHKPVKLGLSERCVGRNCDQWIETIIIQEQEETPDESLEDIKVPGTSDLRRVLRYDSR